MTDVPQIEQISPNDAELLCRTITQDLPEYFGLSECNETYAKGVREHINFAIKHMGNFVGLLSLAFPYPQTGQIYWMGILKQYQGKGLGQALIKVAVHFCKHKEAKLLTVETLSKQACDENYLKTYQFYENVGFQPLFDLKPEGYEWMMVYMAFTVSSFESLCISQKAYPLNLTPLTAISSIKNTTRFNWGNNCEGWWLKKDNNFSVISESMPPNTAERKHYHKETEQFFYCLSGTILIEIEGESYNLNIHDGISISAGQCHKVQNVSREPTTFLVISCPAYEDRVDLD